MGRGQHCAHPRERSTEPPLRAHPAGAAPAAQSRTKTLRAPPRTAPFPAPPAPLRGALRGQCAAAAGMGGAALALLLLLLAAGPCAAQYEEYSVRGFPAAALEPLQRAYARALAHYAGAEWAESARELEASLRLHRLLRDSEAHCHRRCAAPAEGDPAEEPPAEEEPAAWEWERELQLFGQLLRRAGCLRACKRDLPVFQLRYPPAQTLRDFQRRQPYQYLHYALFKVRGPAGVQMPRNVAGGGSEGLHGLAVAGVRYQRPVLHCSDLQLLFYPLPCAPLLSPAIGHTPICASSCTPHSAPLILHI